MRRAFWSRWLSGLALIALSTGVAWADDRVTPDHFNDPGPNEPDEPLAAEFSLERATDFLDSAALQWQTQRQCFTCHTNYAYLYARPSISADAPAHEAIRRSAEQLVVERWPDKGPRWDAEVVATSAALAYNDARTTNELHPITRQALDRMWTLQRADGGWDWLKCGWPPMESDDHYGVTLAAIAAGVAPGDYANSDAAKLGLEKVRSFLRENPAPTLHHQAMVLWASTYVDGLLSDSEAAECKHQLLARQRPDGGWALASLGDWERSDGKTQDRETSDGYGTGFVIFVLRQAGVPAESPAIQRGIVWLKTNQRSSGRWFTRSLNKDSKHFISHAGTAMAVMALATGE